MAKTHQHRNQGWVPFRFHANKSIPTGGKTPNKQTNKTKRKWPATTATRSKWRTISPFITNPKCDKKTSYWKCIHDTFYVLRRTPPTPTPHSPWSPLTPLERRVKKKNGWSLPLVLFNYCFVVQDVQEMSPLLKTLESVYMHCELGKVYVLSFYLSPCILCHKSQLT